MRNWSALIVAALLLAFAALVPVESFAFRAGPTKKRSARYTLWQQHLDSRTKSPLWGTKPTNESSSNHSEYYSDDLFGLIFLSGAFVLQDAVFAATFLLLSTIGVIGTNVLRRLPPGPTVPGVVGGSTLLVSGLVRGLVDTAPAVDENSKMAESLLCVGSLVYGLWPR